MPTFDTQAALQAGVSQQEIDSYLSQHPELSPQGQDSNSSETPLSSPDSQFPATQPNPGPNQNPVAAPVVGSVGQVGELTGAPVGFQNASLSGQTDQERTQLAQITQRLIEAANQTSDPARKARLLQVAHNNLNIMSGLQTTSNQISEQGQKATPNVNIPGAGTISPATSPQQAIGIAAKTASTAISGIGGGAIAGAVYGGGNTLEQQGTNATPISVGEHAATNAAGFFLGGKILGSIIDASGLGYTKAINAATDSFQQATKYRNQIGQDLIKGAEKLSMQNPEAIASLQGNGDLLQKLSEVPGIKIDTLAQGGLNPADVQEVSSQINKIAASSSEKTAGQLYALNNEFRTWAQKALNDSSPGTGDALEGLYDTAQSKYEGMKAMDDVFEPNANPSAKDKTNLINYVKEQWSTPAGRIALKQNIQEFAKTSGIDLSDNVKAMSYINSLPPKMKAFGSLLKWGLGIAGLHELNQHLPF